jgi:primosomal replication protein N
MGNPELKKRLLTHQPGEFDVEAAIIFVKQAISSFRLDERHDPEQVWFHVVHEVARELSVPGAHRELEESPLGLFKCERVKRLKSIEMDATETVWAFAALHVALNHQRKTALDRSLKLLNFTLPLKIVEALLDRCIECSLESVATQLPDMEYTAIKSNLGKEVPKGQLFTSLREASMTQYFDRKKQIRFKNYYMGALSSALSHKMNEGSVIYIGFLHFKENQDLLFCVHNDTGRLTAYKLPQVETSYSDSFNYADTTILQLVLRHMVTSLPFTENDSIVNINIEDLDAFNGLQCELYHWDGFGQVFTDQQSNPKSRLPDILVSALHRLIHTLRNPYESAKDDYWRGVNGELQEGDEWFDTVINRYPGSQWSYNHGTWSPVTIKSTANQKEVRRINAKYFHSCVDVPVDVYDHVSSITLRTMDDPVLEKLPKPTDIDVSASFTQKCIRIADNLFNFEIVEKHVDDYSCISNSFKKPILSLQSLKLMLYVYVFTRLLNTSGANNLDFEEREEVFNSYWQYFQQNATDFINRTVTDHNGTTITPNTRTSNDRTKLAKSR